MEQFLLDNSVWIIFAVFLAFNGFSWYAENYRRREIPDDWFQRYMFYQIAKKSQKRHPGFIGSPIRFSSETHTVRYDRNGNIERVEREQV